MKKAIEELEIKEHPAIGTFTWNKIPQLSLITGINGSGKTKLLEEINSFFNAKVESQFCSIKSNISSREFAFRPWDQGRYNLGGGSYGAVTNEMRNYVHAVENNSYHTNDAIAYLHEYICKTLQKKQKTYDTSYFETPDGENLFSEAWSYTQDVFQNQHIGRLFIRYARNKEREMYDSWNPTTGKAKSLKTIEKKIGEPPWKVINSLLKKYNFKYRITFPEHSHDNYTPRLFTEDNPEHYIKASALSSGEQMILALILWSFDEKYGELKKLIVLDEPDAHLHPEMSKMFKEIICDILVNEFGLQVILTTHSPSTVAFFPEESIFAMEPYKGPVKVSKEYAVNLLTKGIPTLSIDYEGRRQVFVESNHDAERLENLYQTFKKDIPSERSLSFIGIGFKDNPGTGGCTQVINMVRDLKEAGNKSVFGLVDWDKHNTPEERIYVLAQDERYNIENCIYDPLLLTCLTINDVPAKALEIGFIEGEVYNDIRDFKEDRLQNIVEQIQLKILPSLDQSKTKVVEYYGGKKLKIFEDYLLINGHELFEKITNNFSYFNNCHQEEKLVAAILDRIIPNNKDFTPRVLIDAFEQLLEVEKQSEKAQAA